MVYWDGEIASLTMTWPTVKVTWQTGAVTKPTGMENQPTVMMMCDILGR